MARLIFVNRFYWPDEPATGQLLTDLAEALAAAGHEIIVITSRPNLPGTAAIEQRHGVAIQRVFGTRWSRAGLIGKAADFASFLFTAVRRIGCLANKNSIVILMTDPPLLGIGGWLAARLRRAQCVHWIQDVYPEIAMELGGQHWLRVLRPLRDLGWRKAAACVTLGEDMAGVVRGAGVPESRIRVIPNWPPAGLAAPLVAEVARLRHEWNLEGKFVIAYSGNLGRVHDLDPVLDVAAALRDDPRIVFLVIGTGPQRARLEAETQRRKLSQVIFRPPQPRAQLAGSLGVADLHLVTLRAGCEAFVFPSKLYGIAAVARPVLFIGPPTCEIARVVRRHELGVTFARHEAAAIALALLQLASAPQTLARHAAASADFAREHAAANAIAKWRALLDSLRPCAAQVAAPKTISAS